MLSNTVSTQVKLIEISRQFAIRSLTPIAPYSTGAGCPVGLKRNGWWRRTRHAPKRYLEQLGGAKSLRRA